MAGSGRAGVRRQAPVRSKIHKLLLATGNPGKARELGRLLQDAPYDMVGPRELGLDIEVEETGETLEENATLKARTYACLSGLWALADDSGLEVEALRGAPGPFSKRYAGHDASDLDRVEYLLKQLEGVPWDLRGARFRCVIAIASPEGDVRQCQGVCQGVVALEPQGSNGFGYDPVFFLPELDRTMAELTLEEKNRVSHRSRAAQAALTLLQELSNSS